MKNIFRIVELSIICLLLFEVKSPASDLNSYFAQVLDTLDPGQPDTVYLTCSSDTNLKNVIEVWLKTDNISPGDSVRGVVVPLHLTTHRPHVVLDTLSGKTFEGSPLNLWSFKAINVFTPGNSYPGDPAYFPMKLIIVAVDLKSPPIPFGAGEYLLAKLFFAVLETTSICIDSTSGVGSGANRLFLATSLGIGYSPMWKGICCTLYPLRGDVNIDSKINLSDLVYLINYLFGKPGTWPVYYTNMADFNCDGHVLLSDLVSLINLVFKSHPIPCKL